MSSKDAEKRHPWLVHYDPGVATHLEYPACPLHTFLKLSTEKYPNNPAIIFQDQKINYETLLPYVDKLAAFLILSGMRLGERVGILLPNSPQFVIAFYAVLKAGGVVAAINPGFTHDEIKRHVKTAGIQHIICLEGSYPTIHKIRQSHAIKLIILTELKDFLNIDSLTDAVTYSFRKRGEWVWLMDILNQPYQNNVSFPEVSPNQPAVFQFSGGTTGTPKAAIGTHCNLVANTIQFRNWLIGLKEGKEVVLAAIPLFHVYGMVIGMSLSILLGACLVLIPNSRKIGEILSAIDENKVTVFPGVPSLYYSINQYPSIKEYDLKSIKACISGSAPLPATVKADFESLSEGKLIEGYGLSEAPTATHCNPLNGENRSGSIGLPLPDVDCKIVSLSNDSREVGIGEIGELLIRGPQVMAGYYHKTRESKQVLRRGWLHTGDIARMDKDGYFYLEGRKKELIKVGGLQVWPREIEEIIGTHPTVAQVAAAGIPDDRQGEVPAAWIVLKSGQTSSETDIKNWCEAKLISYKVPKIVQFCNDLPRTALGKILRRELVRMYLEKINK
jgi:long-chain acyl-CoA synthetase